MAKDPAKKAGKHRGRKVRVDFRRNREKAARNKGQWTRHYRQDSVQHADAAQSESVRAKGALSRKRTIIEEDAAADRPALRRGIVVRMRGLVAEVNAEGQLWACTVRRVLRTRLIKERHPVTVGDRVRFLPVHVAGGRSHLTADSQELPEGVIEQIEDRTSVLLRHYDRRLQVVAANIDIALIVVAVDRPTLRPHLIDRYLVAAHQGDMRPVICINKIDLDETGVAERIGDRYGRIGYRVLLTSVLQRKGLAPLRRTLQDQTSLLVGPSGVGKSSLLNALDPGLTLRVGSLTDLQRGRHTTSTAELLEPAFGGYVVDTPGMRQFDVARIEPTELEAFFKEFVDRISACRFPDCAHIHEEACAVKAAVEAGEIATERYDSYCKMYQECKEKEASRH